MNEKEKWDYLINLDEDLLKGGVVLSEWSSFLIRNADISFTSGAYLSALITALAVIESYLKFEFGKKKNENLNSLIGNAPISDALKKDLHCLRKFRNKWVHVEDPADDDVLLSNPEECDYEIEEMAFLSMKVMRQIIYSNQMV